MNHNPYGFGGMSIGGNAQQSHDPYGQYRNAAHDRQSAAQIRAMMNAQMVVNPHYRTVFGQPLQLRTSSSVSSLEVPSLSLQPAPADNDTPEALRRSKKPRTTLMGWIVLMLCLYAVFWCAQFAYRAVMASTWMQSLEIERP